MGPKKDINAATYENYWRTCIEETPLDDANWKVKVVIIESAGGDEDRIYLNKFEIFAAEEKRFVIKNICKTETIFMINQLGGEKKVKDENLRVFEEGQSYLNDRKDIPPDILALIIKHLILKMKEEYLFIKQQMLEVKEGIKRESVTMIDGAEVRGTVSAKPLEHPEPLSPPPRGKGKKEAEPVETTIKSTEGKKYSTLLRVRGEEWRDKVYVDDFPIDGPNLYVAITGFLDPYLLCNLIRIGVPLTAVVQVRINPKSSIVPSSLFTATKRGQNQSESLTEKSISFWKDLQEFRISKVSADDFKNTAFVVFCPPYWDSEKLSGSSESIYDEVCYLIYDVQDLTRQHCHYLNNMDIINIPEETGNARYKKYYNQLITDVPLESVTIYSVLDNILETVCKSELLNENSKRPSVTMAMTFSQSPKSTDETHKQHKSEKLVNEIFDALCITDTNKNKYRITSGEEYEHHKDPIIINYGDFAKYTTFHLANINLENVVWSTLYCTPINNLWKNQHRQSGELEAKAKFHVSILISCFEREDIEISELNRLIHILACRKLYNNKSSLRNRQLPSTTISDFKKKYLKRSVLAEPLPANESIISGSNIRSPSFPSMTKSENSSNNSCSGDSEEQYIQLLFDCPDITELVSAEEIANSKPISHMIDNFEFFEEFSGVSSFQIMNDAFNKFNSVDYKYCEVTDCIVLMFYNSHDKNGIVHEEWRCHLPTPLCLQDFFDFVLEEHYDWIQNEDKIYDEKMALKSQSVCKDGPVATKSCIESGELNKELLMEGSLKHQELTQIKESSSTITETVVTSSKKITISPSSERDSKSTKKTKSPPPKARQSFIGSGIQSDSTIPQKLFLGYNLGDRRVEVFGKDSTFFSRDGTRVSSYYTLSIPMNTEYINLNVVPGNGCNEFWFHRALGDNITSDILDNCESFRITTKDGVLINIKKQTYLTSLPAVMISPIENPKEKNNVLETTNYSPVFQTNSFHSLFITWPNGLIIESVYEDNSPIVSHIKQYYVNPVTQLDEEMRCVSLNGDVIIFRPAGNIEIFQPDGSCIDITKYEKRLLIPEIPEDIYSEASSDKSKKGKEKSKLNEKLSKTSTKHKLSKNIFGDDKFSDIKPPQYDLLLEEFELIDTCGLRQKWIKNISHHIEKLLIRTATDFCLNEVFSRRTDGTNFLLNKDGTHIVTFPNKTRIITTFIIEDLEIYPEWTEEENEYFEMLVSNADTVSVSQKSNMFDPSTCSSTSRMQEEIIEEKARNDGYISVQIIYTVEHTNFATVTINKAENKIKVHSPNDTSVKLDTNNNYYMKLDDATSAIFDGEDLIINYEACSKCQSNTTCNIKIKSDKSSVSRMHRNWLKMEDSFGKTIVVNEEGHIDQRKDPSFTKRYPEEIINPEDFDDNSTNAHEMASESGTSVISHGKCREMYQAKTIKFFVLRRDLSCAELIHRALVEDYKRACRWKPWCSINTHDTLGDHRSIVSVLSPIHITETEKWLMNSKFAEKPNYVKYKHLKKDSGKGFYHWMRPYERFEPKPMKPDPVVPPSLPKAFVFRTLEQQWNEEDRETLNGAKELLRAILRYRQMIKADCENILNVPVQDHRSEDMSHTDDVVQALAHRIYEDLKVQLANDAKRRAKDSICTKPSLQVENMPDEELEKETPDIQQIFEKERENLVKQFEAAQSMSSNLQRYWRRRAEELKEEEFNRYLLREGNVPPYFRNVLGGAVWWEMNNAADKAVTDAGRRKMKCLCFVDETASGSEI